jgi:spermidine synthase
MNQIVILLFFLSGFSSLIYEVIWVRLLTRFVGGGNFSVSIVLAVFMGGLALGSLIAARWIDRVRNLRRLILVYGLLELAIGAYAILFPRILTNMTPIYAFLYCHGPEGMPYNLFSSLISTILLILPTTLMGATLPLLCRYYIASARKMGTRMGLLYGINTIGAAMGALTCGFWMIRYLGVQNTVFAAFAMNLFIAMVSIVIGSTHAGTEATLAGAGPSDEGLPASRIPIGDRGVLAILAVSGFCSMAYEVIWTKLLALLVGPTTYSFTIVLFTFILGLAVGSVLFGWLSDRTASPFRMLVFSQTAAAVLVLLSSQLLGNTQLFFAKLLYQCRDTFFLSETAKTCALFSMMLPATLCLGGVFPIAVKIRTMRVEQLGSSVGFLYSLNTVGALLGALCAGFVLIPFLGKEHSLSVLVAVQVVTSCLVYVMWAGKPYRGAIPAVVMSCVAAGMCLFMPRWDRNALAKGRYQRFAEISDTLENTTYLQALLCGDQSLANVSRPAKVLHLSDGIGGFVAVEKEVDSLGITNIFMAISGKVEASSQADIYTQVLSAHIPMLLHSNPANVMVIGLASGITSGEMLLYPLKRLDIAEISPEVVKACELFAPWNNNVLHDPRSHIIIQDGRTHLTLSDRTYDVISSEPSNPWMAGLASLFTKDFFQTIRDHLNPGGIFVQWIHTYQSDWESFSMVGRTITSVFPNSFLIKTSTIGSDYLIVCFKDDKAVPDHSVLDANAVYAAKSRNMRMTDPSVLYPLIISENLPGMCSSARLHTDNHPYLEYLSPMQLYKGGVDFTGKLLALRSVSPATQNEQTKFTAVEKQLVFADFICSLNTPPFGLVDLSRASDEQTGRYRAILERYCAENIPPNYDMIKNPDDLSLCLDIHQKKIRLHLLDLSQSGCPRRELAPPCSDLADLYMAAGRFADAIGCYQDSLQYAPDSPKVLFNLGLAMEHAGRYREALSIFSSLLERNRISSALLLRIAANQLRLEMQDAALDTFKRVLDLDSGNGPALTAIGAIYGAKNDFEHAADYSRRAVLAAPKTIRAHQNLALALCHMNRLTEAARAVDAGLEVDPTNDVLNSIKAALIASQKK